MASPARVILVCGLLLSPSAWAGHVEQINIAQQEQPSLANTANIAAEGLAYAKRHLLLAPTPQDLRAIIQQAQKASVTIVGYESAGSIRALFHRFMGTMHKIEPAPSMVTYGVVIDAQRGIVATLAMRMPEMDTLTIQSEGRSNQARLLAFDEELGIALLKMDDVDDAPISLPLGCSGCVQVGDWLLGISNPSFLRSTVSVGMVSGLDRSLCLVPPEDDDYPERRYHHLIQTHALHAKGGSGGPVITADGKLIGIIFAASSDNVGFAVPINAVLPMLTQTQQQLDSEAEAKKAGQ